MRHSVFAYVASLLAVATLFFVVIPFIRGYWWNYVTQIDPSRAEAREMNKLFSGRRLDDFLPASLPIEEVYWFDYERDKALWKILCFADLYGVRINPSMRPIKLNDHLEANLVGLIASPGNDKDVDYSPSDNHIIEYDPSNGTQSNGDVVHLFYE